MDTVTLEIGKSAPTFSLPDLSGKTIKLTDFLGSIVVVNFWSAECPWAERADIEILALQADWGEKVVVLSIASNANEPQELLDQVAMSRKLDCVLYDSDQQVAKLYSAQFTPHIFVLDGSSLLQYQGAFDDVTFRQPKPTRNYLDEAVSALLARQTPEVNQAPAYGCTVVYYRADEV